MDIQALVIHKYSRKLYVVNLERSGNFLVWQVITEGIYGKVCCIYRENQDLNTVEAANLVSSRIGCPILPEKDFCEVIGGEEPGCFLYEEGDLEH